MEYFSGRKYFDFKVANYCLAKHRRQTDFVENNAISKQLYKIEQ